MSQMSCASATVGLYEKIPIEISKHLLFAEFDTCTLSTNIRVS